MSRHFPRRRHGASGLFHERVQRERCIARSADFLSFGVVFLRIKCHGSSVFSPKAFSHAASFLGGAWLNSVNALVRYEIRSRLIGLPEVTSSKVSPSGGGYVCSAIPRTPFHLLMSIALVKSLLRRASGMGTYEKDKLTSCGYSSLTIHLWNRKT